MIKYLVRDMLAVLKYLPFGIIAGLLVMLMLGIVNDIRVKREKQPLRIAAYTFFVMYLVIMLFITFLSRESGSSNVLDLQLFSTWGINARNNAYVIENILFFVPYGFLLGYTFRAGRSFFGNFFIGCGTSFCIEWFQLVTGRGCFQVDDIITNAVGAIIGFVLYKIIFFKRSE